MKLIPHMNKDMTEVRCDQTGQLLGFAHPDFERSGMPYVEVLCAPPAYGVSESEESTTVPRPDVIQLTREWFHFTGTRRTVHRLSTWKVNRDEWTRLVERGCL